MTIDADRIRALVTDLREWNLPTRCCDKRAEAADVIDALLAERDTAVGAARKVLAECEALNVDLAQVEAEREALLAERDALQVRVARGYFAGWSDAKAGRAYGETAPAASTSDTKPEAR